MVEEKLRSLGLKVSKKEIQYITLDGNTETEERISAYSLDGNIKVIYSKYSTKERKLSILLNGTLASKEAEKKAERLGGKTDIDEEERLYALFKPKNDKEAEEIIDEMLGRTTT